MNKQLYEEALADVKKVKQVAEDNAKRAILEAVTPRIRDFIDQAILESAEDGEPLAPDAPSPPLGDEDMTDLVAVDPSARLPVDAAGPAAAITPPDAEGKVTLDIDALCSTEPGTPVPPPMFGAPVPTEDAEYEISLESIDALKPVLGNSKPLTIKDIVSRVAKINERVTLFTKASKAIRSTPAYNQQIARMISNVENMYDHVQEQVSDPAKKNSLETMLEASFKGLNKLQESTTMSKKTNKHGLMNEADVTLKLTGLPDELDLDSVGVDLITGEDDEEGGEDLGGDDAGGDDLDGLDLGGDEGGSDQGQGQQMESRKLSDNTIVEIDEGMLRREIARMRNLREEKTGPETKAQSWGNGAANYDAFGGGSDEGSPFDAEIVDKSDAPGSLPLGESDEGDDDAEDMSEGDDCMDEGDEMMDESELDQIGNRSKESQFGEKVSDGHETETWDKRRHEGLKRLGFEKRLQERAKARAATLKKEAATAKNRKNLAGYNAAKKEYAAVASRFNESVERAKKVSLQVAKATKMLQESRSNSRTARSAGNTTENATLRKKLAETNLFNAKLLFTNKLLQNESLSSRQKAQVIKQLDGAKTVREAKLVYESLSSTLGGASKTTVNENRDRSVIGSSSRTTRPASTSTTLNEGFESDRWAQLAGITKR